MKLNIYTANNQTDIMHSQLGYIKQNLKSGRKQYIIVPDKFSLTMEKEVMQGLNLNASFGFEVLTFARFANLIVDIKDSKILSSLGATMIIQMLLEKHKAELKCFNKTIKSINFASVIFDSIAQLKACNITASSLKNALPNIKNKLLQSKLSDISFIMQKYEDYLGQEYIDSANRLQLLSQGLKYSQVLKDIDVHFCHFDTTTPKALDIISQVLKTANSVSVGVVVADKNQPNKYIYDDKMLKDILDISKDFMGDYKSDIIMGSVNGRPAELSSVINDNVTVDFYDNTSSIGSRVYESGLIFILVEACTNILKSQIEIKHSIDKGIYVVTKKKITQESLDEVYKK